MIEILHSTSIARRTTSLLKHRTGRVIRQTTNIPPKKGRTLELPQTVRCPQTSPRIRIFPTLPFSFPRRILPNHSHRLPLAPQLIHRIICLVPLSKSLATSSTTIITLRFTPLSTLVFNRTTALLANLPPWMATVRATRTLRRLYLPLRRAREQPPSNTQVRSDTRHRIRERRGPPKSRPHRPRERHSQRLVSPRRL